MYVDQSIRNKVKNAAFASTVVDNVDIDRQLSTDFWSNEMVFVKHFFNVYLRNLLQNGGQFSNTVLVQEIVCQILLKTKKKLPPFRNK